MDVTCIINKVGTLLIWTHPTHSKPSGHNSVPKTNSRPSLTLTQTPKWPPSMIFLLPYQIHQHPSRLPYLSNAIGPSSWNSVDHNIIISDASWSSPTKAGVGIVSNGNFQTQFKIFGASDSGITEAFGLLIATCLAKANGTKKTFLCDNINIIREINTTKENQTYSLSKISPTIWITELIIERTKTYSIEPIFDHVKGHSRSKDLRSTLNNIADSITKEAANSTDPSIFVFQPNLAISDHTKRRNYAILSPLGNIKTTTTHIYNLILDNTSLK
eukprot:TRINITY_DN18674_c0_g1_i16.p1 TRINITY_DN18674_c0_g1~~TRINITY_DN18674_c0_g1_i16.p1  ORF type:complete len:273 (+),score=41.38 TRINITY_DN18674_c0_g1_i16:280-1098(+)